jgi:ATP-dependent RNA helicase DDX51/DBP6
MTTVDTPLDFSLTKAPVLQTNQGLPQWIQSPLTVSPALEKSAEFEITNSKFRLSPFMVKKLQKKDITHFFPVQNTVIPLLFSSRFYTHSAPRDLCVSASTGSGKTLAYAVPIVEGLLNRIVVELRALIVLPTRDLANQVKQELDYLTQGSSLIVGLLTGGTSSHLERADILICTPGRFMDFLSQYPLRLKHLKYLVMDEADRLMNQYFHGWLESVQVLFEKPKAFQLSGSEDVKFPRHVQKLLFSATLSTNPAKLEKLQLHDPQFICVQESLSMATLPTTLKEERIVVEKVEKPLLILHLVEKLKISGILLFVKSVASASRLALLLQSCCEHLKSPIVVKTIHSDMNLESRRTVMREFMEGKLHILTCSDIMARGMDLGQTVQYVINYDIPAHLVTYIHRVGRTARAGRDGIAITLLEPKQVKWFKGFRKTEKRKFKQDDLNLYKDAYVYGLQVLRKKYQGGDVEESGDDQEVEESLDKGRVDESSDSDSGSSSDSSHSHSSRSSGHSSDSPNHPNKKRKHEI